MARYGEDTNRDRWRDEDRNQSSSSRGSEDHRGFFERAGDEVRSWFSDDDRHEQDWNNRSSSSRDYDRDYSRSGTPRSSSWESDQHRSGQSAQSGNRGWGRGSSEGEDRSFFGGMSQGGRGHSGGGWDQGRSNSGWDRDQGRSGSGWDRNQGRSGYGRSSEGQGGQHRAQRGSWGQDWVHREGG